MGEGVSYNDLGVQWYESHVHLLVADFVFL